MSAHTPGPWEIVEVVEGAFDVTVESSDYVIAWVCDVDEVAMGERLRRPITQANARLIANAPRMHDLLAACEPYLKDGETPAQRIERERRDTAVALELLANERIKNEFALAALRRVKETRVWLGAVAQGMVDDAIKMAEGTT